MIYGLYLSATGVITSAYRQDVIANNLANSEAVGFKKDLAAFYQRPTADKENPLWASASNPMLDKIGGGTFAMPTQVDTSPGTFEPTGNDLDAAITGPGYFTVAGADGKQLLTRAGNFQIDHAGRLSLATAEGNPLLDTKGLPIPLDPTQSTRIDINGQVIQSNVAVAQLGVVNVANPARLQKAGGSLLSYPDPLGVTPTQAQVEGGFLERSNVDPAAELAQLMDTQRQLEANANMIRYQDTTLGELVNTVGKIS